MSILTRMRSLAGVFSFVRSPKFAVFGSAFWLGLYCYLWGEQFFTSFGRAPGWLSAAAWSIGGGLAAGAWFASRSPSSSPRSAGLNHFGWAAWTVVVPYLGQYFLDLVGLMSADRLEQNFVSGAIMLAAGLMWWTLPAFLAGRSAHQLAAGDRARALAGFAVGLAVMAMYVAPAFGGAVSMTVLIAGSGVWFMMSLLKPTNVTAESRGEDLSVHTPRSTVRLMLLILWGLNLGAFLPLVQRTVFQWMPASSYLEAAMAAGLALGAAAGCWLTRRTQRSERPMWSMLLAVASCALPITVVGLLAGYGSAIDLNLWINSRVSSTEFAQLLRAGEAAWPMFSIGLTGTIGLFYARPRGERTSPTDAFATGFGAVCGLTAINLVVSVVENPHLRLSLLVTPICAAIIWWQRPMVTSTSRRRAIATAACLGTCLFFAWTGRENYNAIRSAKTLFSTTVFAAYNHDWDETLLTQLDEGRCLAAREGLHGLQTLWVYQGVQYQLRENGIPRGVISIDTRISPDYTGEVLAALVPLVLHDGPRRVLLQGLGAGASLRTMLDFPLTDVVCDEPDASFVALQRHVIGDKLGQPLLDDDRVRVRRLEPVLAVAGNDDAYDVIVSNPPQSSLSYASPSFTREYYQRASDRLLPDGFFCQRFQQADFGARPLSVISRTLRDVFPEVVIMETGPTEVLLIGAKSADGTIREGLVQRLQAPQVRRVLARIGWDWSILLNLNTVMNDQVGELYADQPPNTIQNLTFAAELPREVMRWGQKNDEIRQLTAGKTGHFLKELDEQDQSPELLNRLSDVTARNRLMTDFPDQPWAYRKAVRQQVTSRPRSLIRPVSGGDEFAGLHPEDRRRLDYFEVLGEAVSQKSPDPQVLERLASFALPYDPLLSFFIHHEVAELYARSDAHGSPAECRHRLSSIYFGFAHDRSVRNVADTLQLIAESPRCIADPHERWDHLNGLLQILKMRWDNRGQMNPESTRIALNDIDHSLVAVAEAFDYMDTLRGEVGVPVDDWEARKTVVEKGLVRPLRTYRSKLMPLHLREQRRINRMIKPSDEKTSAAVEPDDAERLTPALDALLPQ